MAHFQAETLLTQHIHFYLTRLTSERGMIFVLWTGFLAVLWKQIIYQQTLIKASSHQDLLSVKHQYKKFLGKVGHMGEGVVLSYKNIDPQSEIYSETFSAWEMLFMSAASPTLIMILKACLLPPQFSFLQGMRKFSLQRGIHGGAPNLPGMQGEVLAAGRLSSLRCAEQSRKGAMGRQRALGCSSSLESRIYGCQLYDNLFFYSHLFLTRVNLRWLQNLRYSHISQPLLRVKPYFNAIILFSLFSFSLSFWWMLVSSLLIKTLKHFSSPREMQISPITYPAISFFVVTSIAKKKKKRKKSK